MRAVMRVPGPFFVAVQLATFLVLHAKMYQGKMARCTTESDGDGERERERARKLIVSFHRGVLNCCCPSFPRRVSFLPRNT